MVGRITRSATVCDMVYLRHPTLVSAFVVLFGYCANSRGSVTATPVATRGVIGTRQLTQRSTADRTDQRRSASGPQFPWHRFTHYTHRLHTLAVDDARRWPEFGFAVHFVVA